MTAPKLIPFLSLSALFACASVAHAQKAPPVKLALSFKPVHRADIEYDIPEEKEYDDCRVEGEKNPFGWVVYGPGGQVIRRYVDTDGDNLVDQWRYYRHGLEVYRDIDTNKDNKVDQNRWLNTAGTRWGLDPNQDGRIDAWKIMSAEEASREAVQALVTGDAARLQALVVNADDLKDLGITGALQKSILDETADLSSKLRKALGDGRAVNRQTTWMRFDGSLPSIVPAEALTGDKDLWVYENAMASVETGGRPGLIQLGELLKVGDAWKLTQVPEAVTGNIVPGEPKIMQPQQTNIAVAQGDQISPEMRELMEKLADLDKNMPQAEARPSAIADYNKKRAEILSKLVRLSPNNEIREQWVKQMIDGLAAAVQTGAYEEGLTQLRQMEQQYAQQAPNDPVRPYLIYRSMLAEYSVRLRKQDSDDNQGAQKWWLSSLQEFVKDYPQSDDAPEALMALAITNEFNREFVDAKDWYEQLAKRHPSTPQGERAAGAIRRFELEGKLIDLGGKTVDGRTLSLKNYRGKAVLVIYWSTWCEPCTQDLPAIMALAKKHKGRGFEVVGVMLDGEQNREQVEKYLREHKVSFPVIFDPAGLQGKVASDYGIVSMPTMFLVDANGRVNDRNATLQSVQQNLINVLP